MILLLLLIILALHKSNRISLQIIHCRDPLKKQLIHRLGCIFWGLLQIFIMRAHSSDICNSGRQVVCQMIANLSMRNTWQALVRLKRPGIQLWSNTFLVLLHIHETRVQTHFVEFYCFPQVDLVEASQQGCFCVFHLLHSLMIKFKMERQKLFFCHGVRFYDRIYSYL